MPTVFDILCTPEGNSVIIPVTASDYVIAVSVSNHHNREKTLLHTAIKHSDISNNSSHLSCCSQLSHSLISKADFDNEWKASVSAWWVLENWGHMCAGWNQGCWSIGASHWLNDWWWDLMTVLYSGCFLVLSLILGTICVCLPPSFLVLFSSLLLAPS